MSPLISESSRIAGIQIAQLRAFEDERGRFIETFRKEWFPQRPWTRMQSNRSESRVGVLRGLHYHFHQVDYWYPFSGRLRVGLADLRPSSPSYLQTETIDMDASDNRGLYIPTGVAHGFLALTDVVLLYFVDNYYDGADEFGLRWNDPDVAVDWRPISPPIVSGRDESNPFLKAIPPQNLPD